jgi:hypothetical protein
MENIINQEKFFSIWKTICKKNEPQLLKLWYKKNNTTEYTKFILKDKNSITNQISENLNLNIKHEYYFVDAIFYKESDLVLEKAKNGTWRKTDKGIWLTKFIITLEHENTPFGERGAYQEICHLLTMNSDLKVLVTYQCKEKIIELVEDLNEIIPANRKDSTPILIIIGYEEENKIIWSAYSLNGLGYSKL